MTQPAVFPKTFGDCRMKRLNYDWKPPPENYELLLETLFKSFAFSTGF
jgi:hypothetical protein